MSVADQLNTQEWNQLYKRHQAQFQKVNEAIVSKDFHPIRRIYFDLTWLKDTRMGLLLATADNTRYHYLEAGLNKYNYRPQRKFTLTYPEFPYTEKQLTTWYTNPKYSYDIFDHSPDTDMSYHLDALLKQALEVNNRCDYRAPIHLVINAYPLSINTLVSSYSRVLQTQFPQDSVRVSLISQNVANWKAATWKQYDALYVDDIARLCKYDDFVAVLFGSTTWVNTDIYSPPTVDDAIFQEWQRRQLQWDDPHVLKDLIGVTEALLQAYCRFHFVPIIIPLPSTTTGDAA